ncbi:MAG: hypothetical protein ACC645_09455 [Pirellulales bacterium]
MRRRRAAMLLETMVAAAVLAALLAVISRAMIVTGRQQQAITRRTWAAEAVANLQERMTAQPWDAITPELAAGITLSAESRRHLPAARLQVEVAPTEDQLRAKRITVTIDWQHGTGRAVRPVRLVTWVFRQEGATE